MNIDRDKLQEKFHGKSIESRLRIVAAEIAKGGFVLKTVSLPPECYATLEELTQLRLAGQTATVEPGLRLFLFGRYVDVFARFGDSSSARFDSSSVSGGVADVTEIESLDAP